MESTNKNNQMFLCELKELRNELSAVKKRIFQLEESHEKQQEKINILERENHSLKKKTQLNIHSKTAVETVLKRKRTDQDHDEEVESEPSVSVSVSTCNEKTKTNNNNNDDDEVALLPLRDNGDSFDSLSDDLLHKIVEFDGNCYNKFGSINKRCRNIYDVKEYKLKKQTCVYGYGTIDMMLQHYLQKRREGTLDHDVKVNIAKAVRNYNRLDAFDWIIRLGDDYLLRLVCSATAHRGKINILSKVLCKCNLIMLDELLDDINLCYNAACGGHLETLKCLRKYGANWDANTFIVARDEGYDEIVQYLRDEGCPEEEDDEDEDGGESSGSEQFDSDEDGDY